MRLLSPLIVLLAIAATGQCLAEPPEAAPAAVTILRGASAPPPPPAPAAPQTTIVYRETVYTPVYVDPPAYLLAVPQLGFRHTRQMAPAPAPTPVPNGWPLLQGGRR